MTPLFAYGSNLSSPRLLDRMNDAERLSNALLRGYRLHFSLRSRKDGTGKAGIEKSKDSDVFGCLWRISENKFDKLDQIEEMYLRKKFEVTTGSGQKLLAWVYVPRVNTESISPAREYLNHVVSGLKESKAPRTLIYQLQATR